MKKAVVTGANGFLGKAVAEGLASMGVTVYAVSRSFDSWDEEVSHNISLVQCDLEHIADLQEIIPHSDIDCFYHFAWSGSAGPLRADYSVQLNNAKYTCDTLFVASKMGCKRFVLASSIMEYECLELFGDTEVPSVSNIYSISKLTAHYMCAILAKNIGIEFIPVIISNIFGEGENSPRLINTTIKKLLNGIQTEFTEGTQMYDFIYIRDAVRAFIAVGERGIPFKEYYLGSGKPRPLREFLEELGSCFSSNIDMGFGRIPFTGKSFDYCKVFDIDALTQDTGFTPEYSFSEGINNTIEWIRKQADKNAKL